MRRFLNIIESIRRPEKREPTSMRLGYVILVDDDIHNFMRKLEMTIAHQYGRNLGLKQSPHITLKQSFEAHALEPFEEYFDSLANDIEPFEIVLNGIRSFEEGVIFLDVVPDTRLQTLRLRILRDLSERFGVQPRPLEDGRYHFHASVAYGMSREAFATAGRALKDVKVDFRFVFNTLGLFYHTGDGWIIYKRSKVARALAKRP